LTNGTFLNGTRLDSNIPVSLRKDDVLTVGDTSFVLHTDLQGLLGASSNAILGQSAPAPGVTIEDGDLVIEEEPIKEDRIDIFFNYLEKNGKPKELRPFQKKFKDFENLVLVADTGLGKTGLATVWSKRKLFYVLPNRTSTNAMFETMKSIFGENRVGLLHSTSLFYIYENRNSDKEDYTILRDFENTRNLSKPITISTADQLFTAVFKYPTYEKIYSTLSYSDVVIDEIQGFDPTQIVPIIYQIKETTKIGAR